MTNVFNTSKETKVETGKNVSIQLVMIRSIGLAPMLVCFCFVFVLFLTMNLDLSLPLSQFALNTGDSVL